MSAIEAKKLSKELRRVTDNKGKVIAYFKEKKDENGIVKMYQVLTNQFGVETFLSVEKPEFDFSHSKNSDNEISVQPSKKPVLVFAAPVAK